MHMEKNAFGRKAISAVTAFVLACSLMPSAAIAYAAENTEGTTQPETVNASSSEEVTQNETSSTEAASTGTSNETASSTDATTEEAGTETETSNASTSTDRISEDVKLNRSSSNASSVSNKAQDSAEATNDLSKDEAAASQDIEMLSSKVELNKAKEASAVLTFNGLNFILNEDGNTVTFTGWSVKAPEGDVAVPQAVYNGNTALTVTAIDFKGAEEGTYEAKDSEEALEGAALLDAQEDISSVLSAPKVKSISIPSTVDYIYTPSFAAFPNLESVEVSDDNETYSDSCGMLLNADLTNLLLVPEGLGVTLLGLAQTCWDLQIPCSE